MRAEQLVLSQPAKDAIRQLRDSKPWRGTFAERLAKFQAFHKAMTDACGMTASFKFIGAENRERPGNGGYVPDRNAIIMVGKLSVVTMLYSVGLVAGLSRSEALKWARELFAHYFPRSYRRCRVVNGMVVQQAQQ